MIEGTRSSVAKRDPSRFAATGERRASTRARESTRHAKDGTRVAKPA
jgi:hypothetical protein